MEQRDNSLPGPGDKQAGRVSSEPRAPEGTLLRQVQDAKESLSVFKNQVSFANQCLSLLQNQMKHAADTLNILQDQIAVAQRTVNNLTESSDSQQHVISHHQSATAISGIGGYQPPQNRVPCREGPLEEQRVIIHDNEGPKIYTLSKTSISLGNQPVLASDGSLVKEQCPALCVAQPIPMHCHCPACLSHAPVQHFSPPFHSPSHGHARTSVHQVSPEVPVPQSVNETTLGQMGREGPTVSQPSMTCPAGQVGVSPEYPKEGSNSGRTPATTDSSSSSPMAHQLLQVIDVLQTADDEDGTVGKSATVTSSSLSSHLPGCYARTVDPQGYEMGVAVPYRTSRRNRKQNMSPVKVVQPQSSVQQDMMRSPVRSVVTKEPLDLMRVPAPVLASTLEPDFLVVPSSSFSYDSPPASVTGHRGTEDTGAKELKLSPESRLAAVTVTSSTAAASEVTAGSSVVTSRNPTFSAARSLSTKTKFSDLQEVRRVARDFVTESEEERSYSAKGETFVDPPRSEAKKQHAVRALAFTSETSSSGSKQSKPGRIDETGSSSLPRPHRRLTGTSPLNSEVGLPFMPHSTDRGSESVLISANSAAEPVISPSAATTISEHALSSSNHVTCSQAPPMTVISIPTSAESSVVNSQRTTTSTKKPIILSRRTSRGEQNIPQGVVVLVPTIEDAKRLIATTGGNAQAHTPVLVPQHMLSEIHAKNSSSEEEPERQQQLIRKRNYDMVSSPHSVPSKRPAVDSVVID